MSKLRQRVLLAALVFFGLNIVGTVGYLYIARGKTSLIDALFMAATTLATVGYGEITAESTSPAGRLFTITLVYSGMVTMVFVTTSLTAFFVEGDMSRFLEKRRMEKRLAGLNGHFIVCGTGSTGYHVVKELVATSRPLVFIEHNEERIKQVLAELRSEMGRDFADIAYLAGDATDDLVLAAAGIKRAQGLIATLPNDKDNLFITIAARQLNPEIRLVARAGHIQSMEKLRRAGAHSVISPNMIGGMRMVSEMIRPSVVTFLDLMLRDKDRAMRIEEVTIGPASQMLAKTISSLELRTQFGCSVLAIRQSAGDFEYNPDPAIVLQTGHVLVVLGNANNVQRLRAVAA